MEAVWHTMASTVRLFDDPSLLDVETLVSQTPLAASFRRYPRFGAPQRPSISSSYFLGALAILVPWIAVAAACVIAALGANICGGKLRVSAQETRRERDEEDGAMSTLESSSESVTSANISGNARRAQLVCGVIIFNFAFLMVGLGFIANSHFRVGVQDTLDAISFAVTGIGEAASVVAQFTVELLQRAQDPSIAGPVSQIIPDLNNFEAEVSEFVVTTDDLVERAQDILEGARIAGLVVFIIIVIFFAVLLLGLYMLFFVQSQHKSSAFLARCLLLFPLAMAWFGVGVLSVATVYMSDTCGMLDEYQRLILAQSGVAPELADGIVPEDNIIFDSGLQCSEEYVGTGVLDVLAPVDAIGGTAVTIAAIRALLIILFPGENTDGAAVYLASRLEELRTCESFQIFAARLNYSVCQPRGPLVALFVAWLVTLLLAILLTVAFFVAQYTPFRTTRFYTPRYIGRKQKPASYTEPLPRSPSSGDPSQVPDAQ